MRLSHAGLATSAPHIRTFVTSDYHRFCEHVKKVTDADFKNLREGLFSQIETYVTLDDYRMVNGYRKIPRTVYDLVVKFLDAKDAAVKQSLINKIAGKLKCSYLVH